MKDPRTYWKQTRRCLLLAVALSLPQISSGQLLTNWVAYNEHAPSALTDPNVTTYNMRGWVLGTDPGTAYPLAGPLTNYVTGDSGYAPGQRLNAQLVASTLLRNPDLFPAATLGYPDPGTPAYNVFMPGGANITDTGNAGSSIGVGNFSGGVGLDTVVLTFNNLDPSMRYKFRGTAVRTGTGVGTHMGRWTISSISGASSFVDAGTAGVLTSANVPGVPALALTNGQQVFQSGVNFAGDMVGWDDINPGPDGSFSIITKGYGGPVFDFYNNMGDGGGPGSVYTNAYGALGYALSDIVITEYGALTPVSIVTQPTPTTTLTEFYPLMLSVKAFGSAPLYQWYKDTVAIPGANDATYSVPAAQVGDSGTYTVVVHNSQNSLTSAPAQVTVLEDTVKPTVVSAIAGGTFTQINVQFSERIDLGDAVDPFSYSIVGGSDPTGVTLVSEGTTESGTAVILSVDTPLTENTVYQLKITGVKDLAGNESDSTLAFSFRTWVVTPAGGARFEVFTGIGGNAVADLVNHPSFPGSPAVVTNLTSFSTREFLPTDSLEGYGGRLRGMFIPQTSGNWVFYLSSDDSGQLSLNPNGPDPAGKIVVQEETGCCNPYSAHATSPYAMEAGRAYYIEALYKEGTGGDYCHVWAGLQGVAPPFAAAASLTPADTIPGALLGYPSAPAGAAGTVTLTQQPVSITTNENQLVTFTVAASNTYGLPMVFQWRKNGDVVPGVSGPSYSFVTTLADHNSAITAEASIVGSKVLSSAATLRVVTDTIPPVVVSASANVTFTNIILRFDELITTLTAEDAFGYEITAGPTSPGILGGVLQPDGRTVVLNLNGSLQENAIYTLAVNSPTDLAGNTIAAGTTVQVQTWKVAPGFVTFEAYNTGGGNAVSDLISHPSFPNNPRETFYLSAFDTRKAYPDDSHEAYGGRLSGVFIPPTSGNWIFYLNADDGSELYLNPAGPQPAGKTLIQSRVDCCATFGANASAPQALTAGGQYYIEALYKEGTGGDYCRVAAKLDTDPTDPDSLTPISGSLLGTYVNPIGLTLTITGNPVNQTASRTSASQSLGLEDFSSRSGGLSVLNGIEGGNATLPGDSWLYKPAQGTWTVLGADGVRNSALSTPYYVVSTAGAVSMTFNHRYNFEKDTVNWDGGLVRLSANRGPYTTVPAASIAGDTYATDRTIGGNCPPVRGQYAYNGQSAGFVTGSFVTSTASLGTFNAGDVFSVQFIGAWDEGTIIQPAPAWEITSLSFSPSVENSSADGAVTFTAAASGVVNSTAVTPYYQWQRDDGAGFIDINFANGASYSFVPSAPDDGAIFRCAISIPGASGFTTSALLSVVPRHTIALSGSTAIISWPAPSTGYALEQASALLTPETTIWTPVGIAPIVSAGMNTVSITGAGVGQKFYRLKK